MVSTTGICNLYRAVTHLAAASLLLIVRPAAAEWMSMQSAQKYSGDGTYYCQTASDDAGSCGFGSQFADSEDMPWSTGVKTRVAINMQQYNGSLACGLCIMFRGTGSGLGTVPISTAWTMGRVTNRCGECGYGAIDLCSQGNGRWSIEWYPVPCNVGASSFRFDMFGQPNPYWFSFTVSNTRVPIKMVEMKDQHSGAWTPMRRGDPDNHWNANGGPYTMPVELRLTSVLGDKVEDTLAGWGGGMGRSQFPSRTAASTTSGASSPQHTSPAPAPTTSPAAAAAPSSSPTKTIHTGNPAPHPAPSPDTEVDGGVFIPGAVTVTAGSGSIAPADGGSSSATASSDGTAAAVADSAAGMVTDSNSKDAITGRRLLRTFASA